MRGTSPRSLPSAGLDLTAAAGFAEVAAELAGAADLDQVLATVLEFAVRMVRCDWATIQLESRGPHAAATAVSDSRFARTCAPQRVHVVDLAAGELPLGTITFYATQPDSLAPIDLDTARVLAVHAALAITAIRHAADLAEAIESRAIIGRAQGIVMERYAVDDQTAFAMLRNCSQDNNIRLREVAEFLITARRLPGEQPLRLARGGV